MAQRGGKVWVYGATGFTGRLVCASLRRRGVAFGIAGRDRAKLDALASELGGDIDTREAPLFDPELLYAALSDAGVIVSCAGPFSKLGEPVLRAALHAGAHYLDTTGEQAFMRDIYQRYEAAARRAGVCFVNACAFEVALGDWAAALAGEAMGAASEPVDEVTVAYALEGFHRSRGTQLSALEQLAAPGVVWERDRWDPMPPAAEKRTFGFPAPFGARTAISFPSGEVITVPRHVPAHRVQTYLSLPPGPLGAVASRAGGFFGAVARSPLMGIARRRVAGAPEGPTPGQREVNDFAVAATATRGFESAHVCITGTDVYGTTGEIVALGVARLLDGGPRCAGVCAPAEAFDARESLAQLDVRVTSSFELS
jgi:short subunit dehydrogenase-like uncharacterized protein